MSSDTARPGDATARATSIEKSDLRGSPFIKNREPIPAREPTHIQSYGLRAKRG